MSKLALLCSGRRGLECLRRIGNAAGGDQLVVVSFREEPWEPHFLDDIRETARSLGSTFVEARNVERASVRDAVQQADLLLAVGWRYLIPPSVFERFRLGAFVFHDSLLPEYRGFSPTVWAILNGEDHTGVSLFAMSENVDAGDLVAQVRIPIGISDTIGSVAGRVTDAYLDLLDRHLPALRAGTASLTPQDHARATYTCRRLPSDNQICWDWPSRRIYDLIRAVTVPYPGAFTHLDGRRIRVWEADLVEDAPQYVGRIPGRVVDVVDGKRTRVLTGDGMLSLRTIQLDDGDPIPAAAVLNSPSHTLTP